MAYYQPKSFIDGSTVRINNDWLHRANSRNYHHYFPRAFLRKEGYGDDWSNHIANITIVDDFLNKREIKAKAPSVYMQRFKDKNPNLKADMQTHLIELEGWGIWENDYELFLQKRCEKLAEEIKKRLILRDKDLDTHQTVNLDDVDELALETED
jgi:hypothetical protein